MTRAFVLVVLAGSAVALSACQNKAPAPRPTIWTFDPASVHTAASPADPPAGTRVVAKGTYAVLDIGKPGVPKLSGEQLAWVERIESSGVYRNRVSALRFVMLPGSTPLVVYDACGGGWGEPRHCKDFPRLDQTYYGAPDYHVIGAACNELLALLGPDAPRTFAGRDPTCDVLPESVGSKENLDEPFNVPYLVRHGVPPKLARQLVEH